MPISQKFLKEFTTPHQLCQPLDIYFNLVLVFGNYFDNIQCTSLLQVDPSV